MRMFKGGKFSSTGLRLAAVAGLVTVLAACHGTELESVQGLEPQGSEFNAQLYAGYIELSSNELTEFDYRDSDKFAMKAALNAAECQCLTGRLARWLANPIYPSLTSTYDRECCGMLSGV